MDIDCMDDIRYCLGLNEKPGICGKIRDLLEDGGQTV
ncbi:hypothetical protein CENSYa_1215 [Cenarchaeum symbiosum A]|uniref:Uncharacterized protein n=1 Tax=Cenarchaeum symbiosum (strain A) TaxID=414004 RepID=A0RWX2_CENSY|nr:hypothetical protein CENSYa_1215 [Cenarchaeum symbiosum A]